MQDFSAKSKSKSLSWYKNRGVYVISVMEHMTQKISLALSASTYSATYASRSTSKAISTMVMSMRCPAWWQAVLRHSKLKMSSGLALSQSMKSSYSSRQTLPSILIPIWNGALRLAAANMSEKQGGFKKLLHANAGRWFVWNVETRPTLEGNVAHSMMNSLIGSEIMTASFVPSVAFRRINTRVATIWLVPSANIPTVGSVCKHT